MSVLLAAVLVIVWLLVTSVLTVLWLIGKSAVTQEASNVLPDATRSLIDRAKNRLPEDARLRYQEEWPAGFEEAIETRPIWAFREAVSLYRGARRIARELDPAPVPADTGGVRVKAAADSAVANASQLVIGIRHRGSRFFSGVAQFERLAVARLTQAFMLPHGRGRVVLPVLVRLFVLLTAATVLYSFIYTFVGIVVRWF